MPLSDRDWKIISHLNMQNETSIKDVAQRTGFREHTVRRTLSLLYESGIVKQNCYIDPFALGYQRVGIFFSLQAASDATVKKFVEYLMSHEKVCYFAEISGEWQYNISLLIRSHDEVADFFDEIVRKFGPIVASRGFESLLSLTDF